MQEVHEKRKDIGWDKKNFLSNFLISTGTQFFASFLSFLISYFIIKKYNEDVLGGVVVLVSVAQVFVFLSNWSLVSVQKLGTEEFLDTGNIQTIFSNRFFLLCINYAVAAAVFLVILQFLPINTWGGILALIYGFVLVANIHFYAGFQARKRLRWQGMIMVLEKLLLIAALFLMVNVSTVSVNRILLIYLLTSACSTVICLILSRKQFSFNLDRPVIKNIIKFSLPLIPYSLVAFLSTNFCDSFFLNKYVKDSDIALYSIAYQFNGIWLQIPTILGTIILPFFITSNKQHSYHATLEYIKRYGIALNYLWGAISFCFIIGLFIVLPLIYHKFTTDFFVTLYLFIAATCVSFSSGVFFSPFLLSNGELKIALPLAIVSAVTNITGNLLLIPVYGIVGSALSSVIFAFLYTLLLTIYVSWKYKINLQGFFINYGLIFLSAGLVFFYPRLLVSACIFVVVYLLLLLLNREKTMQAIRVIFSGISRKNTVVAS